MSLSAEEMQELQELEELELLESKFTGSVEDAKDAAPVAFTEKEVEDLAQAPDPTFVESASAAVVDNFFIKDVVAGTEAVKEAITNTTDDSISDVYEDYRLKRSEMDQTIKEVREKSPGAALVGDVVVNAPTMMLGAGIRAVGALGGIQGLSQSEERTMADAATGTASSLVFMGLGTATGKAMVGISNAVTSKISGQLGKDVVTGVNKANVKVVAAHLRRTGQSTKQFSESLIRQGAFKPGQSLDEIGESLITAQVKSGKKLGKMYQQMDDAGVKVDVKSLYNKGLRQADELANSRDVSTQKRGQQLKSWLDKAFKEENKTITSKYSGQVDSAGAPIMVDEITLKPSFREMSNKELHDFQVDIAKDIKNLLNPKPGTVVDTAKSSFANEKKSFLGNIINTLDDSADQLASKVDKKVAGNFNQAKLDFRNVLQSQEVVEKRIHQAALDASDSGIWAEAKNAVANGFSIKGAMLGTALASGGSTVTGGSVAAGLAINGALRTIRNSPAITSRGVGAVMGFDRLMGFISKNPSAPIVNKLLAVAELPNEVFKEHVMGAIGHVNLLENPVKRSSEDAESKANSIISVMETQDKELAQSMRDTLSNSKPGELGPALDAISKIPGAEQYFEPGIGIDGRVFSVEDKAMLENDVKSQDMPAVQRMEMLNNLRKDGIIPDFKNIQQHQPRPFIPRDKKKQEY